MKTIPLGIHPSKRSVVVLEATTVSWTYKGEVFERTIPAGYEARPGAAMITLFVLAALTYPFGLLKASVVHDYLYDEMEDSPERAVPRAVADAALLADEEDPRWLRRGAWAVVRAVGWIAWLLP